MDVLDFEERMRKVGGITGVLLFWVLLLELQVFAQAGKQSTTTNSADAESAIRTTLQQQVTAWNRGDLKGYMRGYWHSDDLTFFAGSEESTGWEKAYQRYRAAYAGKNNQMGRLAYSNVRVMVLSPDAAFVRGGWELTMKDGSKRQGLFTLIFKRFNDGWRIVHDHSS